MTQEVNIYDFIKFIRKNHLFFKNVKRELEGSQDVCEGTITLRIDYSVQELLIAQCGFVITKIDFIDNFSDIDFKIFSLSKLVLLYRKLKKQDLLLEENWLIYPGKIKVFLPFLKNS